MAKRTVYPFDKQITAIIADEANNSVWVAFAKNNDGNVILERQSAFDPIQTYSSIPKATDAIVDLAINTSNIFVAFEDSTLLGQYYSLTTPLSSSTEISKPVGVIENSIGVTVNGLGIFFLTPGNLSGTDAEVHIYSLSGTFDETIILTGINNAISITSDDNDEVWVVTNNSPAELIRIYPDGGVSYNTETTLLN